jgi:hypothetical protein
MAFGRSHSRGQTDQPDYDKDNWVGVTEIKVAATHFRQEKKYAHSNNYDGPHEAADAATLAGATNAIAHLYSTSRRSLLRPAVDAIPKHQKPYTNENEGPEPSYAVPLKPFKIVEQEQDADTDQYDRANGFLLAEIIERVR